MEDKYKNYRIKEEDGTFYPQYYKTLWWHSFTESRFYDAEGWTSITVKFHNLEMAKIYIKDFVKKQEEEFQKHLKKMENLDMKPKFHKIS